MMKTTRAKMMMAMKMVRMVRMMMKMKMNPKNKSLLNPKCCLSVPLVGSA